ncbi:chaperonin [Rahnella sp. SAP-1]|uniref:Chaperonin n=1 Tax=Rouxiella aceris TaxID=2703884 RepID=A0A848MPS2_9GAMM|nr:chaperonin [Rouxiella aceris]NMP29010.1 chaperonin [Rouxiella aceris]
MTKITERLKHNRITNGYCNICGTYELLTKDHVPPKCAITLGPVLQKTVNEFFHISEPIKPLNAQHGAFFKTICSTCNNDVLGGLDKSIEDVTKVFRSKLGLYMTGTQMNPFIRIPFDSVSFTKAMIGHILSATSVEDCKVQLGENPFYTPLRSYVVGKISSFEDTHDIYYWFYPHRMHISAQSVSFMNEGHVAFICALHFFPIGFMVTIKGEGTFPAHATKLKLKDEFLIFNMTAINYEYTTFPFVNLKGDQMYAISSGHTCVSYPLIK